MEGRECSWDRPGTPVALSHTDVHVWRASLNLAAARVQCFRTLLATDEVSRAERFHFQQDRQHFIAARGLLRLILSQYLEVEPGQLRFCYGRHGKPALATPSGQPPLTFNVSHSRGLALFAVTWGRAIGIDLEYIRPIEARQQIAANYFSPRENAALLALPLSMQHEAFFGCWTRKEAYIKARGDGLSLPLDQFDVSLSPNEPARLLKTGGEPQEAARWSLQELYPAPGYAAALAVEGHGWRLTCWRRPEEADSVPMDMMQVGGPGTGLG